MISEQELVLVAGASTFTKGQGIYQQGHVQLQMQSEDHLTGLVSGTYDYRVSVISENNHHKFSCTCPAFEYQEVCKHCVALVLASIRKDKQNSLFDKDKSASNINQDEVLKQYINNLPREVLHAKLHEFICDNKYEYNRWTAKAKLASEQQSFKSLKKLATKALPLKNIWEYGKVAEYFIQAQKSLDDIFEAAKQTPPEDHLKLIFYVYDRLEKVLERVDDSGGYRFSVQDQLSVALPKALARQNWSAIEKAKWLMDSLKLDYEGFAAIPDDFKLAKDEMHEFLVLCQTKFNSIDVHPDISQRHANYELKEMGRILLSYLPKVRHFEDGLKIKAKMASDLNDALCISQFCLDNNDELTAEDWLLKARKLISAPHLQSSWNSQAIKIYTALNESKRAWRIAWQNFIDRPGYYSWRILQENISIIGWHPDTLKTDVESILLALSDSTKQKHTSINSSDIAYFYLSENELNKAITWLDRNEADESLLTEAAIILAPAFPSKAIHYCTKALLKILEPADNRNYQEAVSLLKKLETSIPDDEVINEEFTALIDDIAQRNNRRPNMMTLLRDEFGQYF